MPRRKLSEYRAKTIINKVLGSSYTGWEVTGPDDIAQIDSSASYVVKVDQAVKGRFKKGLVLLDVKYESLRAAIAKLTDQGYSSLLVEPYIQHDDQTERYLFLSRDRDGYHFAYSAQGGIDVEATADAIEHFTIKEGFDWENLAAVTGIAADRLQALLAMFKANYFTTLEINPYIADKKVLMVLDIAVEVDDAGQYFTRDWSESDIRNPRTRQLSESEQEVLVLNDNSPASFNLSVLNPDGSIFLLLSGGGASVVIADEVYNIGLGEQLANYGEYSGNPNTQETYTYTKQVLKLIIDSKAKRKVLFIGGAVANFTDIANTFAGIIMALDETAETLKKQHLKVYVRRGGPNQEIGLQKIQAALDEYDILGGVYGPDTSITEALGFALEGLKD